jgi:hypothetical protein
MFINQLVLAAAALAGLIVLSATFLRAWEGWLHLKREELALAERGGSGEPSGMARIEMADIKERLRKLEAIAAGVEL